MSYLVANPEDRISRDAAMIKHFGLFLFRVYIDATVSVGPPLCSVSDQLS